MPSRVPPSLIYQTNIHHHQTNKLYSYRSLLPVAIQSSIVSSRSTRISTPARARKQSSNCSATFDNHRVYEIHIRDRRPKFLRCRHGSKDPSQNRSPGQLCRSHRTNVVHLHTKGCLDLVPRHLLSHCTILRFHCPFELSQTVGFRLVYYQRRNCGRNI